MITSNYPLGSVTLSNDYFAALVSEAAKNCFGVAGLANRNASDTIKSFVLGAGHPDKGVLVTAREDGRLEIHLHIMVSYGLNISAAAQSISHRVREVVEQSTGLKVARINVSVDDIIE